MVTNLHGVCTVKVCIYVCKLPYLIAGTQKALDLDTDNE